MTSPPTRPRGVCCHEAGHAVVAFSFGLRVAAVRVAYSEKRDWYGAMDAEKPQSMANQITLLCASKMAEKFFDCPAHNRSWFHDYGEIDSLLSRNDVPVDERPTRIDEGEACACTILEEYREQARRLTDRLVERGCIDNAEFLRLMTAV
jgi:hypothetical protein